MNWDRECAKCLRSHRLQTKKSTILASRIGTLLGIAVFIASFVVMLEGGC